MQVIHLAEIKSFWAKMKLMCCVYFVCRYDVTLLRNDSDWLSNIGETKTVAVRNAAVMTVVIESNETNVS